MGRNSSRYDKPARPRTSDVTAKPESEARAWVELVRKHKVTAAQARECIGISPRQIGGIAPHWAEYRALVLELFNRSFPGEKIVLESRTRPEHHLGSMLFRKPETVPVKMLVSIAGLADPDAGFQRDWSFDAGEITSINPKRAEVWQNAGKCVILTAEQAKRALEHPTNGDKPLDDLESILRASGRCGICDKHATRVLRVTPLCSSCYGREIYVQSATPR